MDQRRKWLATVALTVCVCLWLAPFTSAWTGCGWSGSEPAHDHSETYHLVLPWPLEYAIDAVLLIVFGVPLGLLTALAFYARRDGRGGRVSAGLLGFLCASGTLLIALGGVPRVSALGLALGGLLGLGLMALSFMARYTPSGGTTSVPVKRAPPWSAVAAGIGLSVLFAGALRS